MSEVLTFRAATMQEALQLVRNEMGAEAVILHTRQFTPRRLLPWRKRPEQVEITAGLGVNIRPQQSTARAAPQTTVARSASAATTAQRRESSRAAALGLQSSGRQVRPSAPPSSTASSLAEGHGADGVSVMLSRSSGPPIAPSMAGHSHGGETATALSMKLDSIQKTLDELGRSTRGHLAQEVPSELFNLYTGLIDAEVEDDLARELVGRLKENATTAQLADTDAAKALLLAMVESEVRCSDPITPQPGKRKVVALVGATGVGKTTTIAKLAANFRLRDGVKMGLVTVDTYRIAAVEQLRTYAEIIDLPMKVVTSPLEMRRAMDELMGLDLVLIDTAGRSPHDDLQIQELKSLLSEAGVDEVHLVLSLTASMRNLEAAVEKFSAANTSSLILTKLDEAAGMGPLLSLSRKVQLPVSYLTTGQDVPDDIEHANSSRIARLVLGRDTLFD